MRSLGTKRNAWAALAALLVAKAAASCTVFDDLKPDTQPAPDAGAQAGAGGDPRDAGTGGAASGVGGADAAAGCDEGGALDGAYLSLCQAIVLCARVSACPTLGPSIRASIGVPVGGPTFSHCVHWLTTPLPTNRPGIAGQQKMLAAMAAGTDCTSTLAEAYVEKLDPMDKRCEGHQGRRCSTDAPEVIDCTGRLQVERCGSALLGESTQCIVASSGAVACATEPCPVPDYSCVGAGAALSYCPGYVTLEQSAGCAERGLACTTATIPFSCAKDGAPQDCMTPGDMQCAGDVAKLCADAIGTTPVKLNSPFDCAAIGDAGAKCAASTDAGAAALRCELAGSACSPEDGDTCSGSSIGLCVGGEPTTFDCATIGMSCKASPVAHCE